MTQPAAPTSSVPLSAAFVPTSVTVRESDADATVYATENGARQICTSIVWADVAPSAAGCVWLNKRAIGYTTEPLDDKLLIWGATSVEVTRLTAAPNGGTPIDVSLSTVLGSSVQVYGALVSRRDGTLRAFAADGSLIEAVDYPDDRSIGPSD